MQISSAQSSAWSSLAMPDRQALPADDKAKAGSAAAPVLAAEATDSVSLHDHAAAPTPATAPGAASGPPPEVFAEIWKDGMKIGVVYTDGHAALPSMPGSMAASANARLPYLRAEEISQQVGGEVRYVNIPALQAAQTRAQLRAAYGG